jgi:hypothetical protein
MALYALRQLLSVVSVLLTVGGCAAGSAPPGRDAEAPPLPAIAGSLAAPTWVAGDLWVYEWSSGKESGTKTVEVLGLREAGGARYYVVRVGDAEHYYTEGLHWAAAVREGKVEARMAPAQPWFQWPLAPGARWSGQSRFEHREAVVTHHDRFTVVGPESLDVPAGRYQAMKVTRETDKRDRDEYWYAPDVRWYVRWVGRRADTEFDERLREYRAAPRPR